MLAAAVADLDSLPYDVVWIFAVASYADVAAELHAEGPARLLLDLLVPFDDQVLFIGATAGSPVAYYCGSLESVLGRYNEAERHFAKAAELTQQRSNGVRRRGHLPAVGPHALCPRRPRRCRTCPRSSCPSSRHSCQSRVRQCRAESRRRVVEGTLRLRFGKSAKARGRSHPRPSRTRTQLITSDGAVLPPAISRPASPHPPSGGFIACLVPYRIERAW